VCRSHLLGVAIADHTECDEHKRQVPRRISRDDPPA
jgi:hypothetical protein